MLSAFRWTEHCARKHKTTRIECKLYTKAIITGATKATHNDTYDTDTQKYQQYPNETDCIAVIG